MASSVVIESIALSLLVMTGVAQAEDQELQLYDKTLEGKVWSQATTGVAPVAVTVKLTCVASEPPSDTNHWRRACSSILRVENQGKLVASLDHDLPNIDFELVGGNGGSLELALLPAGDGAFVQIIATTSHGDMTPSMVSDGVLLLIAGKTLRTVYHWEPARWSDPGPSPPESATRVHVRKDLQAGAEITRGLPNLLLTTIDDADGEPSVEVFAWNGSSYAFCHACKPLEERRRPNPAKPAPAPALAPAPAPAPKTASPPSGPPDFLDASGQSFEPVLAAMLAGKPIQADALTALSDETLIKLRNAPYARHGRPFKLTSLQAFFYGKRDGDRRTPLLPLTPNAAFKESMLDPTDTQNVHAIVTEQNRRKPKK